MAPFGVVDCDVDDTVEVEDGDNYPPILAEM
jgi:hypothetical protein